jgi:hypothetical protein
MLPIPLRGFTAWPIMNVINKLALSFLDDTIPDSLANINTRELEIKHARFQFWAKKPRRMLVGRPSDIVIHRRGF